MSFIQWLGDWLRKVSTSVKSITAGTNTLTYTKHNNDTVTIPLTLESDLYVKKTGDIVTGNINSLYGVDGIETVNQFSGEMAGNDLWAIRTGITGNPDPLGGTDSTTTDNGFLEIATADNGTEPIYIAQYEGDHMLPNSQGIRFYQRIRRATLLDEQGNTVFPGTVTAASFNGTATSANHAANANYATSAEIASKLGSVDVGSATQPIYLNDGVATACTYQLFKTVPSDAVFTDTIYIHPTTSGNKHIPSGGSSGQILRWSADGTAEWGADNNATYSNFTGATSADAGSSGLVPAPAAGKNTSCLLGNGTWGLPTYINTTEATLNSARPVWFSFAGDNQRPCYNTGFTYNPGTGNLVVGKINGFTIEKSVPADAKFTDTVYTHPTGSGNKHIPSGGASGDILQWIADGNAYWTPRELRFYAAQKGSTTTNPWYKVASFSATEANYNAELVLLVNDTYYGLGSGILKINVRFGSDKHVRFQDSRFVWLSNSNFSYDDFVLVQPSSNPDTVELWTQIRSNWTYRFFTVLTQGSRVTREQLWYFHNSASQGQAAAPTSGTQLVSTAATRSYDNVRKFEDGTMMMFTTRAWTGSSTDYTAVTFTEPFIAPPAVSLTFFSTTGATNQIRVSEITATGFKWAYRNGTAYTNGASASFMALGRWK